MNNRIEEEEIKKETGIDCKKTPEPWYKINGSSYTKKVFGYRFSQLWYYHKWRLEKNGQADKVVAKDIWMKFLKTYLRLVAERIVNEGFIFIMPYFLGRRYLKKSDKTPLAPYNPFKIRLKRRMINLHSFRKFYGLKWDKENAHFKNRSIWKLKTDPLMKKMIAKAVFSNNMPIPANILVGHKYKDKPWN